MFGFICELVSSFTSQFDSYFEDTPPSQIVASTAAVTVAGTLAACIASWLMLKTASKTYDTYKHWNTGEKAEEGLDLLLGMVLKMPVAGSIVDKEIEKQLNALLRKDRVKQDRKRRELGYLRYQPEEGQSIEEILTFVKKIEESENLDKLSGARYAEHPPELLKLLEKIYTLTAFTNPLHSCWPILSLMQAELINWGQDLFHGEEGGLGLVTHGGTTSIFEACSAYVLEARKKGIQPEIIIPVTAHVAFDKAAKLLGAKLIKVPVDESTGKVDLALMEKAIKSAKNPAMIVGSAPSFMDGICDDIEGLSELALKHKVGLHVDSCLGGFLTAYSDTEKLGIGKTDFRLKGVTSISADTHKYGQTPKGSSLLLFRKGCPYIPTSVHLKWRGGMYVTPGLDGSRSGTPIVAANAVMRYYGKKGFKKITAKILHIASQLREKISALDKDDINIFGNPKLSVIGLRSKKYNIHLLALLLEEEGWEFTYMQNPNGIHFCLTKVHAANPYFINNFMDALNKAIAKLKQNPNMAMSGNAKAYGVMGESPIPIPPSIRERLGRKFNENGLFLPQDIVYLSKYLSKALLSDFEVMANTVSNEIEIIPLKANAKTLYDEMKKKDWPVSLSADKQRISFKCDLDILENYTFVEDFSSDLINITQSLSKPSFINRCSNFIYGLFYHQDTSTAAPRQDIVSEVTVKV